MKGYLRLMRVHQWLKNLFIAAPLFFSGKPLDPSLSWWVLCQGLLAFSLLSSSVYIINDYRDVEQDRRHPQKRERPLASGAISTTNALKLLLTLLVLTSIISLGLPWSALALLLLYLLINLAYSFYLQHLPIADIAIIAFGFLIRIVFGAVILHIPLSHWIVIMVTLLALLLALGKRRGECLSTQGQHSRKVLEHYSLEFINASIGVFSSVLVVIYILYTISPEITERMGDYVYLTTAWVILGLLRYLQLTFVYNRSEFPTRLLLEDRFLQAILLFWIFSFVYFIYA